MQEVIHTGMFLHALTKRQGQLAKRIFRHTSLL